MIIQKLPFVLLPVIASSHALGAAGDIRPVHPVVPTALGFGALEVVGGGYPAPAIVTVQLTDVATDDTAFRNNLACWFYNMSGQQVGLSLVIPEADISDEHGNNDGNIDNNDYLTLDLTTVLQNRPAGAFGLNIVYADPGGDGDSLRKDEDGFLGGFDPSDVMDETYRIITTPPRIMWVHRLDRDSNGVDDTLMLNVLFPSLGYGKNALIRSSFLGEAREGIPNPNVVGAVTHEDWEKTDGKGGIQFEPQDVVSVDPIEPGATTLTFSFDESTSDLIFAGPMDFIRVDSGAIDIVDWTGNALSGEAMLQPSLCSDGEPILADCNDNGLCDRDEIAMGMVDDCNENGVPDICEILAGATDYNQNGILDECEPDPLADLDGDGVVGPRDLAIILAAWGPVLP